MIPDVAWAIIEAVQRAANPGEATRSFCENLFADTERVRVLAVGKAGATMMQVGRDVLGDRVSAGLVIAPDGQHAGLRDDPRIRVLASDHPLPTERSVAAAEAMLSFVGEGVEPLIVLLSGGGSALAVRPSHGLTLDNIRELADCLMRAGATIDELNCVRKHLDGAKGGRVGVATRGRPVAVGVISDVLGDRLDVISSGPFVGDASTFAEALGVLDRLRVHLPAVDAVINRGAAGEFDETPKPGDNRLGAITHEVLASNAVVARVASDTVKEWRMEVELRTGQSGEASAWGAIVADRLKEAPGAIVLGGESVVSNVPAGALGGPVQEAVLAAGHALRDVPGWLVIGYATDGIDGPTDAAGGVLTPELVPDPDQCERALQSHQSHAQLRDAGALIRTGPTGTNLNDVLIGIRWDK